MFSIGTGSPLRYIFVGLNAKITILRHWLAGRRNGVSASELVRFLLLAPSVTRGRRLVDSICHDSDFNVVRLRGLEQPIYYPRDYELLSFYINILPQSPDDWHSYECEEVRVAPEDVVIDCGAAEGLFSLAVAGRCKEVYAIEPLPRFVKALERTFAEMNNVEILPFALSDRIGEDTIVESGFLSSIDMPRKGIPTLVNTATIDSLFFERGIKIDFIKADLEGHEMHVLAGAEKTIRECLPKIAITSYHRASHADDIGRFLKKINGAYNLRTRGISDFGTPLMVYAWVE